MKKQAARIVCATTEPDMTVAVALSGCRTVRIALTDLTERLSVFAPLENPGEFASARAADFGWPLEWDCGATLDVDRIVKLALEQAGMATNVAFAAGRTRIA